MEKNEIIEMARQAGFTEINFYGNKVGTSVTKCLEAFAKLVASAASDVATAKEREACAKVCDRKDEAWKKAGLWNQSFEYKECADAIRARGEA